MKSQGSKKATRIFVARIPQSVDESMFRRSVRAFILFFHYLYPY
jgi:RNA-binding protein Musashi